MEQIYRSTDGLIFESKGAALKHEFKINNEKEKFIEVVNKVLAYMNAEYNLTFEVSDVDSYVDWDQDPNSSIQNYTVYQELEIEVFKDGKQLGETFARGAASAYYNEETLKEDLVKHYVHPYLSTYEGVLSVDDNYFSYESIYKIGDFTLDVVMPELVGKRIRLEVLD